MCNCLMCYVASSNTAYTLCGLLAFTFGTLLTSVATSYRLKTLGEIRELLRMEARR